MYHSNRRIVKCCTPTREVHHICAMDCEHDAIVCKHSHVGILQLRSGHVHPTSICIEQRKSACLCSTLSHTLRVPQNRTKTGKFSRTQTPIPFKLTDLLYQHCAKVLAKFYRVRGFPRCEMKNVTQESAQKVWTALS